MTFYLYRDARQPFLETIAPIIFALFANALNVVFSSQFEEFSGEMRGHRFHVGADGASAISK